MLKLPDITELRVDKADVLSLAMQALPTLYTTDTDPAFRARLITVRAYREHLTGELRQLIETRMEDAYRSHEIISEPRDEIPEAHRDMWDESLSFLFERDLREVRDLIGANVFDELAGSEVGYHEPGRIGDIAAELAGALAPHYVDPDAKSTGKFLSKLGIAKADLNDLIELAKGTPIPSEPPPEEQPTVDEPEEEEAAAASDLRESLLDTTSHTPPTKEELSEAVASWAEASGPDFADFAERIGSSGQTLRNYAHQKTKPKLNASQAAILAQDCEDCIGKLQRALAIFRRVRPVNGRGE